jgi:hypothetical protein
MVSCDGLVDDRKTEYEDAVRRAAAMEPSARPPPSPTIRARAT